MHASFLGPRHFPWLCVMRASQLGVHIGWALSLTRTRAFTSSSVALRSLPKGHAAVAIPQHVARRSLTRSIATRAIPTAGWVKVGISVGTQTCARTRRMWQPSVFMSSAQGMNPESFTERAWDAMVKLPTLADANKAQVIYELPALCVPLDGHLA